MPARRQFVLFALLLAPVAAAVPQVSTPDDARPKSQLARQLLAAQTAFEVDRDRLYAELRKVQDAHRRLEMQQELEQLKQQTELQFLQIQLENARQLGDAKTVEQLETMLNAAQALNGEAGQ